MRILREHVALVELFKRVALMSVDTALQTYDALNWESYSFQELILTTETTSKKYVAETDVAFVASTNVGFQPRTSLLNPFNDFNKDRIEYKLAVLGVAMETSTSWSLLGDAHETERVSTRQNLRGVQFAVECNGAAGARRDYTFEHG